ncbi:MAG: nickel pincer cofactor biosynthesis protein LarB [Thermoanaerobacteraceae bacterium]|nr:nickel pincer cofactor biosynthesis protein LarB [Thermoanaerobacteraceae bacterium]
MTPGRLRSLLEQVQRGQIDVEQALAALQNWPYENLGFARLDHLRALRQGFPEVIFCQGKTVEQVQKIFRHLAGAGGPVLATRATGDMYEAVKQVCPEALYHHPARCIVHRAPEKPLFPGTVLVISAGTADLPVAEEAAVCALAMGNPVERLYDVGVAGLHRLLDNQHRLGRAAVIIVVAGMEGALASVVGGLTSRPVIAVPTSVGYGASFGGLAALLAMLNSCASGVGVVNIDNGFGAAALATAINRLLKGDE